MARHHHMNQPKCIPGAIQTKCEDSPTKPGHTHPNGPGLISLGQHQGDVEAKYPRGFQSCETKKRIAKIGPGFQPFLWGPCLANFGESSPSPY